MASTSDRVASQLQTLLAAGQYEQMARLLGDAGDDLQQEGDTAGAAVLNAAAQVCLTCTRLRRELAVHARAQQELAAQEEVMKQQLQALLQAADSAEGRTAVQLSPPVPDPPSLIPRLKQRLQRWFTPHTEPDRELDTVRSTDETATAAPADEDPALPEDVLINGRSAPQDPTDSLPNLFIYTLGLFRVYQNDQLIQEWNGLKGLMILKYLVMEYDKPIPKDILMDIFWPEADFEAARRNLHQAVYSLRQTLREQQPDFQHILYENDCYLINPDLHVWIDCTEFQKNVQLGQRLQAEGRLNAAAAKFGIAEGLYQGNFLDEDRYEEWVSPERERLRTLYLHTADRLGSYYQQRGECTIAITLCQKILAYDNCHEGAYRRLIQCYKAQGQRHLAIRTYQQCEEMLKRELDLTPTPETVAVYRQITGLV